MDWVLLGVKQSNSTSASKTFFLALCLYQCHIHVSSRSCLALFSTYCHCVYGNVSERFSLMYGNVPNLIKIVLSE